MGNVKYMEKVMSVEDKIRRAEEIYYKRCHYNLQGKICSINIWSQLQQLQDYPCEAL